MLVFSNWRPKKWMSATLAFIFLLNVTFPAHARRGNYGETSSLESFGAGALAGAVTSICIAINPVVGTAGSIAGDLTGTAMYRYSYDSYGETMFEVFGMEVSKGQFWSMVASVVASVGVGIIEGLTSGAVEGVAESAAEAAAESAVEAAGEAAGKAVAEAAAEAAAEAVAEAAVEAAAEAAAEAVAEAVGKALIEEGVKKAVVEAIKKSVTEAVKGVVKEAVAEAVKGVAKEAIKGAVESAIKNIASKLAQTAAKVAADTFKSLVQGVTKVGEQAIKQSLFTRILKTATNFLKTLKKVFIDPIIHPRHTLKQLFNFLIVKPFNLIFSASTWQKAGDAIVKGFEWFKNQLSAVKERWVKIKDGFQAKVKELFSKATEKAGDAAGEVKNGNWAKIGNGLWSVGKWLFNNTIVRAFNTIKGLFTLSFWKSTGEWIYYSIIEPLIVNPLSKAWNIITHPWASIKTAAGAVWDQVTSFVDGMLHPVRTAKNWFKNLKKMSKKTTTSSKYARYAREGKWGMVPVNMAADITVGTVKLMVTNGVKDRLEKEGWDDAIAQIAADTIANRIITPIVATIVLRVYGAPFGWSVSADGGYLDENTAEFINNTNRIGTQAKQLIDSNEKAERYDALLQKDESSLTEAETAEMQMLAGQLGIQTTALLSEYRGRLEALDYITRVRNAGLMEDIQGRDVNQMGILESGVAVMKRQGLAPILAPLGKMSLLWALKYKSYYGDDRDKKFTNLWKMAVADAGGNIFGGIVSNIDSLGSSYAKTYDCYAVEEGEDGEPVRGRKLTPTQILEKHPGLTPEGFVDENTSTPYLVYKNQAGEEIARYELNPTNPWRTRPRGDAPKWTSRYFLPQLIATEAARAGGQIAWGKFAKDNNIESDAFGELLHVYVGSAASGLIDAVFRRAPRENADSDPEIMHASVETGIGEDGSPEPTGKTGDNFAFDDVAKNHTDLQYTVYDNKFYLRATDANGDTKFFELVMDDNLVAGQDLKPLTPLGFVKDTFKRANNRVTLALVNSGWVSLASPGTGPYAFDADQARQAKWYNRINAMAKGASPTQAIATQAAGNLNAQANDVVARSVSGALSPLWLGLGNSREAREKKYKYGTYVVFSSQIKDRDDLKQEISGYMYQIIDLLDTEALPQLLEERRDFDSQIKKLSGLEDEESAKELDKLINKRDAIQTKMDNIAWLVLPVISKNNADVPIASAQMGEKTSDHEANFYQEIEDNREDAKMAIWEQAQDANRRKSQASSALSSIGTHGYIPLVGSLVDIVEGTGKASEQGRDLKLSDIINQGIGTIYEEVTSDESEIVWKTEQDREGTRGVSEHAYSDASVAPTPDAIPPEEYDRPEERTTWEADEDMYKFVTTLAENIIPEGDQDTATQALEQGSSVGIRRHQTIVYDGVAQDPKVYGNPQILGARFSAAALAIKEAVRDKTGKVGDISEEDLTEEFVEELRKREDFKDALPKDNEAAKRIITEINNKSIKVFAPLDKQILLAEHELDAFGRMTGTKHYGLQYRKDAGGNGKGDWKVIRLPIETSYYYGSRGLMGVRTIDGSNLNPSQWNFEDRVVQEEQHEIYFPTSGLGAGHSRREVEEQAKEARANSELEFVDMDLGELAEEASQDPKYRKLQNAYALYVHKRSGGKLEKVRANLTAADPAVQYPFYKQLLSEDPEFNKLSIEEQAEVFFNALAMASDYVYTLNPHLYAEAQDVSSQTQTEPEQQQSEETPKQTTPAVGTTDSRSLFDGLTQEQYEVQYYTHAVETTSVTQTMPKPETEEETQAMLKALRDSGLGAMVRGDEIEYSTLAPARLETITMQAQRASEEEKPAIPQPEQPVISQVPQQTPPQGSTTTPESPYLDHGIVTTEDVPKRRFDPRTFSPKDRLDPDVTTISVPHIITPEQTISISQPLIFGANVTDTLYFYEIGNASHINAGPSHQATLRDVNSGPYLQAAAHYPPRVSATALATKAGRKLIEMRDGTSSEKGDSAMTYEEYRAEFNKLLGEAGYSQEEIQEIDQAFSTDDSFVEFVNTAIADLKDTREVGKQVTELLVARAENKLVALEVPQDQLLHKAPSEMVSRVKDPLVALPEDGLIGVDAGSDAEQKVVILGRDVNISRDLETIEGYQTAQEVQEYITRKQDQLSEDEQGIAKLLDKYSDPKQRESLRGPWATSVLRESGDAFAKYDEEMNSDLTRVTEMQGARFREFGDKIYALPTWGTKTGYNIDATERFNRRQAYVYSPEGVRVKVSSTDNAPKGLSLVRPAGTNRTFVVAPSDRSISTVRGYSTDIKLPDALKRFGNLLPDDVHEGAIPLRGVGANETIPLTDIIKGYVDVEPVALKAAPQPTLQQSSELNTLRGRETALETLVDGVTNDIAPYTYDHIRTVPLGFPGMSKQEQIEGYSNELTKVKQQIQDLEQEIEVQSMGAAEINPQQRMDKVNADLDYYMQLSQLAR